MSPLVVVNCEHLDLIKKETHNFLCRDNQILNQMLEELGEFMHIYYDFLLLVWSDEDLSTEYGMFFHLESDPVMRGQNYLFRLLF